MLIEGSKGVESEELKTGLAEVEDNGRVGRGAGGCCSEDTVVGIWFPNGFGITRCKEASSVRVKFIRIKVSRKS